MEKTEADALLDELYELVLLEDGEQKLTDEQSQRYLTLVELLNQNNIEITFGITI
jgi:hypothetical protein